MKLYDNFINDGTLTNFYGGKTDSGYKLQINQNKMTAVEQLIAEIEQELQDREGCNGALNSGAVLGLTNAKNIAFKYLQNEKQNLLDMSVKSALHERKWVYEEMSDKKYKPTKVEIRDLQETALEHYNITFK